MKKFSFIFQSFFKLFLIFLFVLVWVRYFVNSLIYSVLISAVLTFIIDLVTRLLFNKKHKKISILTKEKEDAENMFLSLAMEKESISFFSSLFISKDSIVQHKDYLSYKENGNKIVVIPLLAFLPLTINDIAQTIKKVKKEKSNKIIIIGGEYTKDCYNFINIFEEKIILLDKYQTYENLYKRYNIYPEIKKNTKETKRNTFKEILAFSFNRSKTKGYIISALALLFCSLFVRNTLYYSIVSSILLIFAIVSLTNPFTTATKTNDGTI